ncbi:hypothetical protein NX722_07880 [Endozoicomonas gorgoniicola]|uniref:Uncharacterized protein n=1 Tax=Endozoicomonas gorgoniicola TaxID=1234144 RepID=A0ABT3MU20_9GAMM|nr:hypothetical protein [Endozoicomonas gorgoniicola]MCW7552568.1 hypothetical protein [Endozoicomonas gorgoniicola]
MTAEGRPLTARKIAELLAMHMVSRDIACVYPDEFNQDEVFKHADEQSQRLIRHFEAHRRHLLEALAVDHPEVKHVI